MTTRTFRPSDPDQLLLLPPSLRDWLPEDHLASCVADLVDELDLPAIYKTYGGVTRGTVPYDPRMLVKVLLDAYAVGVPASRQIARELDEDVAFRVLAANQRPDFRTISDFHQEHLAALATLFVQVLTLCQRAGLVKLGHVALDGTKVKANASKHKAMSYGRMVTEEARLQAEAALTQAARDAQPPTEPRRGRPPSPPRTTPPPTAQRNFTDPDSRIMPASEAKGSFVQGYNCQAAVDATAQIIGAADVTHESNDKQQAQPMLTQVLANTGEVPRVARLDAGYFNEANVEAIATLGCEPLIPPDRQTHGHAMPVAPRGRPPAGLSVAERMRRTLRTKRGQRLYARRNAIVEPVFGQIKHGRGFRQFLLRGLRKVQGEWALICTTHNVRKLWTSRRRRPRCPGPEGQALERGKATNRRARS